jgi:hypothetical protein
MTTAVPAGVANTLGFSGVGIPHCTRYPCPDQPLHRVRVCVQLNAGTKLVITRGCGQATDTDACGVKWDDGMAVTYTTEGKALHTVNFDRQLPSASFLKLNLCAAASCPAPDCFGVPIPAGGTAATAPNTNKLIRFEVDGVQYGPLLHTIGLEDIEAGCVSVICPATCCSESPVDTFGMPIGTEITFGPLGSVSPVAPPLVG